MELDKGAADRFIKSALAGEEEGNLDSYIYIYYIDVMIIILIFDLFI